MLELSNLNIWAIAVAWLISVALGSLWYSPIGFGKLWSKLSGVDIMKMPQNLANKAITAVMAASLVQVFVLAVVVKSLHAETVQNGLMIGLFLWAGLVAATAVGNNLYLRLSWKFWWLNTSFFLVAMSINGILLSVWH